MYGIKILKDYPLGDMVARYVTDGEEKQVGLMLLPADLPLEKLYEKEEAVDALVQVKLTGDIYNEAYALGNSMRNGESVRRLALREQRMSQESGKLVIETVMEAPGKYEVTHTLSWRQGDPYVRIFCTLKNTGEEPLTMEMFESFSLGNLSPYQEGDGHEQMFVYRARSVWSQEGRMERIPVEDLQLEPAWDPHAVRCEKFGQVGSMPVNRFFPFAALEDAEHHVFWGAQIAHNASWQMEIYRKDEGLALSGGLADRDFGHWMKTLAAGERCETPEAIVSAAHTDSLDIFTERLTRAALEGLEKAPESERNLPVLFNEYCTTWGNPSHENIQEILQHIRGKGFQYFVIDCGWYKEEGIPWDISMGDYEVSKQLFPEGLEKTVQAIKDAGMVPGLWFEIENVGRAARAYQMEEHLLHKDGAVLTSYFRRFWDMRDPWVQEYLAEKVIGTLKKYGFGYMKIDYNETIGMGCDGAESLGEGLRQNMEASTDFIEKVKREIPGIVLENCSSGGHRLEPGLMGRMSMASFSDAHECPEIPIIAANLHRLIHPAQSQIWAVIRQEDTIKRIVYSVANTFLGRMCISGDVTNLSEEQWRAIDDGIAFYHKIAPVIKNGVSFRFGPKIKSLRHPRGWQGVVRMRAGMDAYVTVHTFESELPEVIGIPLPEGCPENMAEIYAAGETDLWIEDRVLKYRPKENWEAMAVRLTGR
ncbi:MAG TPA: alpha-galactosidase [Lachnospiraceae bacterium]|nr:alpha-galactosidase [Lachnospiraceae bacterium]